MPGLEEPQVGASVDPDEVARFDRLAATWWDTQGPMKPLHRFNPVRVDYLKELLAGRPRGDSRPTGQPDRPLEGLEILDIGCGAGILSEALAKLGAEVTGIDPAPTNIAVARLHAGDSGLTIDYRQTTAEALAEEKRRYDVVLAMEVVEHVRDVQSLYRDGRVAGAAGRGSSGGDDQPNAEELCAGDRRRRICAALAAARHARLGAFRHAARIASRAAGRRPENPRGNRRDL